MKYLIAVSCLLAVASAGFVGHTAYTYPTLVHTQHLPVIGVNGVPLDEPAVAIAKAEHAAAHLEAKARNGDVAVVAHHVAAPVAYAAHVAAPVHYAGVQHLPIIGANGVPLDEPAVVAARAQHASAHIEAKVRNGEAAIVAAQVHYPVHHVAASVVPSDTVEVAAAKSAHFAAHVEAKARNGLLHHYAPLVHYRKRRGVLGYAAPLAYALPVAHYAGPQHLPIIGANGVPLDEPAVVAARAQHAVAHVDAKLRNGDAALITAPVHYASTYSAIPVVSHVAGPVVPADTPEVAAAKAEHFAAHVEAKVRNGDLHHVVHAY